MFWKNKTGSSIWPNLHVRPKSIPVHQLTWNGFSVLPASYLAPRHAIFISLCELQLLKFRPGHGTLDQIFTLTRILEGSWEFTQTICVVDLENMPMSDPVWTSGLCLFLVYDVVLLLPLCCDLHHAPGQSAAKCGAARMRISTSKSWFTTSKGWSAASRARMSCCLKWRTSSQVLVHE